MNQILQQCCSLESSHQRTDWLEAPWESRLCNQAGGSVFEIWMCVLIEQFLYPRLWILKQSFQYIDLVIQLFNLGMLSWRQKTTFEKLEGVNIKTQYYNTQNDVFNKYLLSTDYVLCVWGMQIFNILWWLSKNAS